MLFAGDAAFAEFREEAEATMTDENSSINNALTNLADRMKRIMQSNAVTETTSEAFSYLDVAGCNYMDESPLPSARGEMIHIDSDGDVRPVERGLQGRRDHGGRHLLHPGDSRVRDTGALGVRPEHVDVHPHGRRTEHHA